MRRNRIRVHLCSSVVKKCISRVLRHVRRSSIERRWKPLVRSGESARSSYPPSHFRAFLCIFVATSDPDFRPLEIYKYTERPLFDSAG